MSSVMSRNFTFIFAGLFLLIVSVVPEMVMAATQQGGDAELQNGIESMLPIIRAMGYVALLFGFIIAVTHQTFVPIVMGLAMTMAPTIIESILVTPGIDAGTEAANASLSEISTPESGGGGNSDFPWFLLLAGGVPVLVMGALRRRRELETYEAISAASATGAGQRQGSESLLEVSELAQSADTQTAADSGSYDAEIEEDTDSAAKRKIVLD